MQTANIGQCQGKITNGLPLMQKMPSPGREHSVFSIKVQVFEESVLDKFY